ncbi:MAG: hypothetical protein PVF73_13710 [Bacteroidales bacterium]|jgi:hypothetical protein
MEALNLKKLNTVPAGIVIGIIVPAIPYLLFIHSKVKALSVLKENYGSILMEILPLFLSRCIFPNALLFFLLIWMNQMQIAKGLLIITAILTAILLLVSFIS